MLLRSLVGRKKRRLRRRRKKLEDQLVRMMAM
jgi:hypothetical protein